MLGLVEFDYDGLGSRNFGIKVNMDSGMIGFEVVGSGL